MGLRFVTNSVRVYRCVVCRFSYPGNYCRQLQSAHFIGHKVMNNHEAKKRERFNAFVGNEKIRGKVQICSLNPDLGRFQPQGCHRHAGTNGPNGPAQPHLWPPCHGPAHVPGALCKLRPSGPA